MFLLREDAGSWLCEHGISILAEDADLVLQPARRFSCGEVDRVVALLEQVERVDGFERDHDTGGLIATPIVDAAQREYENTGIDQSD